MGFFSNLLRTGARLLGFSAPAPARAAARVAPRVVPRVFPAGPVGTRGSRIGRAAVVAGGTVLAGAGFAIGDQVVGALTDGGGGVMGEGGNGETFRRTIVQTIRSDDGVLVKQVILRGAPHLMQHDLVVAKKVFRLSSKLHQRLPKRTVKTSRIKLLTQQVLENALEARIAPLALCPPKG